MSGLVRNLLMSGVLTAALCIPAAGLCDTPAPAPAQPQAEVSPMSVDFGTVDEGVKSKATFTIKNAGKADLMILDVRPTCGCTVANLSSKQVAPGASATLDAVYDSHNASGAVHRYINVRTNDPKMESFSLGIIANVIPKPAPEITLSLYNAMNLQLGAGKSEKRDITVTNSGVMDLVLSEVTTSPGISATMDKDVFAAGQMTKAGITMKPGETRTLSITVAPKRPAGYFQEVLTIRSNAKRLPAASFIAQGIIQ